MQQDNVIFYNPTDELDDDISINFEKLWKIIWSRRELLIKVFCSFLAFFVLLTFIIPKKYKVTADLYINKTNVSNIREINPYILDESTGSMVSLGSDKSINNEIELMKSELVLDKVIRDNNIKYKKGKKKGEFITAEAFYKKGKVLKIANTKNTNVITIQYKSNKPDLAYGVVSSLITNYIELHKKINTEKSKSDKQLLEEEYNRTKEKLDAKINQASGLPANTMSNIGNLSAISAFSKSASTAINSLKNQYLEGQKSQIAVSEESQKLSQLATKLEWAKMVEQMSDSSKVLILKEPKQLRPFENSSPKLIINIIIGCLLGGLASLIALIYVEQKSKKLTFSMLTKNIIFNGAEKINNIKVKIRSCKPQKVLIISFVQLSGSFLNNLQNLPNCGLIYYNGEDTFVDNISMTDKVVLISSVGNTDAEAYKIVRDAIKNQQKDILFDVIM